MPPIGQFEKFLKFIKFQSFKKKPSYGHLFLIAIFAVGKGDIICPSEILDHWKATSLIIRNYPCEYSDWRQRIQKMHYNQNVIALNLYIDINELVYERRLMMKVFFMTKFLC